MGPLSVVELQGVGHAVDDAVGDAGGVAALEPDVVLDGDAGEEGDLLAAQARDPPAVAAVGGQAGLRGSDPGPSRAQELPDLLADVAADVAAVVEVAVVCRPCRPLYERSRMAGGPCQYPFQQGLPPPRSGWLRGRAPPMRRCPTRRSTPEGRCTHMTDKKVWFITGAGRGMGVDIAKAALAAGHAVVATGRNADRVSAALGDARGPPGRRLDVTDPAAAEAAVTAAVERFGRIDVLVNNAGNFYAGFFEEISPEDPGRRSRPTCSAR